MTVGVHYCKWCEATWDLRVPDTLVGDALLECPRCGYMHPRQFELGVAVSCEPPHTRHPIVLRRTITP